MIKKLLFLLMIATTAVSIHAATDYGFSVGGTTVTSDNCNNITSNYITSGTVSYNPNNNTLTLYNVTINMTGSNNRCINNLECSDLTIMFRGTCNLTSQDASAIRIRKETNLMAPQATDVVNITGVNDVGIWMATTNDYELWIMGPGKFNISSTKKPAIEDEDNSSGIQLDLPHFVYFDNVNAVLSSAQDNVCRRFAIKFKAGSSVRFKATKNSSKPIISSCSFGYEGNEAILEPYGAYYSNNNIYDSSGNKVYNKDIYVSDYYVAILNSTYFPDDNFRNYLLTLFPYGYITSGHVDNYGFLDLSYKQIANLQGIQYFTKLSKLVISDNRLTSVDLSKNTKLETLYCSYNNLTSLNLNNLSNLEGLNCSSNKLTSLIVTNKSKLKKLYCINNKQLTGLYCLNNKLSTLTVTGCSALKTLNCAYNNLTSLNVTGCDALQFIYCYDNKINGSGMTALVNSLPMRSAIDRGLLYVLDIAGDNNAITDDQLIIAINKYWKAFRGDDYSEEWEEITPSSNPVLGDMDGNGVVDVEDVNAAINIILKLKTVSEYPGNGDMDGNGIIDVEDVNAMINIILKL